MSTNKTVTTCLTIQMTPHPILHRSGSMQLVDLGSQLDPIVQIQRQAVQFAGQKGSDIPPVVSVQTRPRLAGPVLHVRPWQKNEYFARRKGSEYVQFDGQKYGLGLPFLTKLVCDLVCVPHMASFLRHRSLNFENHEFDEV